MWGKETWVSPLGFFSPFPFIFYPLSESIWGVRLGRHRAFFKLLGLYQLFLFLLLFFLWVDIPRKLIYEEKSNRRPTHSYFSFSSFFKYTNLLLRSSFPPGTNTTTTPFPNSLSPPLETNFATCRRRKKN